MRENSATVSFPDIPLPPGAVDSTEWYDADEDYPSYRIVNGRTRSVGPTVNHFNGHATGLAEVETTGDQLCDGSLALDDPPQIHVHVYSDNGLNAAQAREVAAQLLEAADEVEGWAR